MNLLTMKNATKVFTERKVLDNADFYLETGERVGVIGINGTGKSSLLKIIAGIEELDLGEIVKGSNIHITYLPQEPILPKETTVLDYVMETASEGQAKSMLNRLGFDDVYVLTDVLSGGQKKKAALAKCLLSPSDVYILDEPTNHLDQDMVKWLEDYLANSKAAIVMVTHDRYFLDRVCNRIVELDQGHLYSYDTNYEGFLLSKAEREERDLASFRKNKSILRKEIAWVQRGARARTTKQKARLERYEQRKAMQAPKEELNVEIQAASTRLGKKTLELTDICKSYGDRTLINNFTYIFLGGDRVGIIGPNGCGKSTLMKIISGELEADSGSRDIGTTVKIGYFSQENEKLDAGQRVIDYIRDTAEYVRIGNDLISASMMLERFLFDGTLQYQKIEKLSGGEKRRLYLLKVLMEAPNLLILDEPTNDLDIQTLSILEDYLDDFQGIVVTVSHDRYFLDRVVRRIFAFEENGRLRQFEGGYSDYELVKESEEDSKPESAAPVKVKTEKPKGPSKLKMTYNEQREYATIEDDIAALEDKISAIDKEMNNCTTDFVKLNNLTKEKDETEKLLEEKMERYVYLEDLAEKIKNQ